MATIKSFTSLEQSKKLAEILPLESADMCYLPTHICDEHHFIASLSPYSICTKMTDVSIKYCTPCWSLAALLGVLPKIYYPVKDHPTTLILGKPKDKWCALYWDTTGMQDGEQTLADNPVDACYEMIIKLYELNLL